MWCGAARTYLLLLRALVLSVSIAAASAAAAPGVAAFDVDALEAFVDGAMAAQFEALDLAGAAVTVVQVGGPTFGKGYGAPTCRRRLPWSTTARCSPSGRSPSSSSGPR